MNDAEPVQAGEPVKRREEIEEISNLWLIHPVSGWLVPRFARWGVSANMVSLAGMGCGLLAGVAYHQWRAWGFCVAGFLLMVAWHVMDGADGQLARLTWTQSELGKVLDGICDYVTFIAVYVALAASLAPSRGGWVWALVACAGVCHAVQAAAYEAQRQDYMVWGCGRRASAVAGTAGGGLQRVYAWVQGLALGADAAARERLAATIAGEPGHASDARTARIRATYRAVFAPRVRVWAVMSANYRTLGIFVFSVAGRPLAWFWFEAVGLSVAAAVLLAGQRGCYARLFTALAAQTQPDPAT